MKLIWEPVFEGISYILASEPRPYHPNDRWVAARIYLNNDPEQPGRYARYTIQWYMSTYSSSMQKVIGNGERTAKKPRYITELRKDAKRVMETWAKATGVTDFEIDDTALIELQKILNKIPKSHFSELEG